MGLHREQSRGKLPRDPLVLILGAHFRCSVFPSMSHRCGSHRNSSKRPCVFARVCVFSQVFDGAVIVLSLAPMVASTVANGPSSPWDAIGLIITLRIWRVKRIIDGETRRGRGLMSAASCPLLSGYRDRFCSVLSVVSTTFNPEVVGAIIFIYSLFSSRHRCK